MSPETPDGNLSAHNGEDALVARSNADMGLNGPSGASDGTPLPLRSRAKDMGRWMKVVLQDFLSYFIRFDNSNIVPTISRARSLLVMFVFLLYFVLVSLGIGNGIWSSVGVLPPRVLMDQQDALLGDVLSHLVVILLAAWAIWPTVMRSLSWFRKYTVPILASIPIIWTLYLIANNIASTLIGRDTSDNQEVLESILTQVSPALFFLKVVICAPIVEEFVFRHQLIGELSDATRMNRWLCVGISALVFTGMHFAFTGVNSVAEVIPYLLLALVLSVSYVMTGMNLGYSILIHMFNNLIAFSVMMLNS